MIIQIHKPENEPNISLRTTYLFLFFSQLGTYSKMVYALALKDHFTRKFGFKPCHRVYTLVKCNHFGPLPKECRTEKNQLEFRKFTLVLLI